MLFCCAEIVVCVFVYVFPSLPAKKGNSDTGEHLKLIIKYPEKTASILDCSEELLFIMHELLGMLESTKQQDVNQLKMLAERALFLFKQDFGDYSQMSPSLHRALQHSVEFMADYQDQGFTIGELSETAQEAINAPTKKDVSLYSFRGSHGAQNLGCFIRNWMTSDPYVLEYAE